MNENFISERLAQLRIQKGVSARDMSLTLGQADNYINSIENKKMYPSMTAFLYICDYLNVSPKDFFDDDNTYPELIDQLLINLKKLDEKTLIYISGIVGEIVSDK